MFKLEQAVLHWVENGLQAPLLYIETDEGWVPSAQTAAWVSAANREEGEPKAFKAYYSEQDFLRAYSETPEAPSGARYAFETQGSYLNSTLPRRVLEAFRNGTARPSFHEECKAADPLTNLLMGRPYWITREEYDKAFARFLQEWVEAPLVKMVKDNWLSVFSTYLEKQGWVGCAKRLEQYEHCHDLQDRYTESEGGAVAKSIQAQLGSAGDALVHTAVHESLSQFMMSVVGFASLPAKLVAMLLADHITPTMYKVVRHTVVCLTGPESPEEMEVLSAAFDQRMALILAGVDRAVTRVGAHLLIDEDEWEGLTESQRLTLVQERGVLFNNLLDHGIRFLGSIPDQIYENLAKSARQFIQASVEGHALQMAYEAQEAESDREAFLALWQSGVSQASRLLQASMEGHALQMAYEAQEVESDRKAFLALWQSGVSLLKLLAEEASRQPFHFEREMLKVGYQAVSPVLPPPEQLVVQSAAPSVDKPLTAASCPPSASVPTVRENPFAPRDFSRGDVEQSGDASWISPILPNMAATAFNALVASGGASAESSSDMSRPHEGMTSYKTSTDGHYYPVTASVSSEHSYDEMSRAGEIEYPRNTTAAGDLGGLSSLQGKALSVAIQLAVYGLPAYSRYAEQQRAALQERIVSFHEGTAPLGDVFGPLDDKTQKRVEERVRGAMDTLLRAGSAQPIARAAEELARKAEQTAFTQEGLCRRELAFQLENLLSPLGGGTRLSTAGIKKLQKAAKIYAENAQEALFECFLYSQQAQYFAQLPEGRLSEGVARNMCAFFEARSHEPEPSEMAFRKVNPSNGYFGGFFGKAGEETAQMACEKLCGGLANMRPQEYQQAQNSAHPMQQAIRKIAAFVVAQGPSHFESLKAFEDLYDSLRVMLPEEVWSSVEPHLRETVTTLEKRLSENVSGRARRLLNRFATRIKPTVRKEEAEVVPEKVVNAGEEESKAVVPAERTTEALPIVVDDRSAKEVEQDFAARIKAAATQEEQRQLQIQRQWLRHQRIAEVNEKESALQRRMTWIAKGAQAFSFVEQIKNERVRGALHEHQMKAFDQYIGDLKRQVPTDRFMDSFSTKGLANSRFHFTHIETQAAQAEGVTLEDVHHRTLGGRDPALASLKPKVLRDLPSAEKKAQADASGERDDVTENEWFRVGELSAQVVDNTQRLLRIDPTKTLPEDDRWLVHSLLKESLDGEGTVVIGAEVDPLRVITGLTSAIGTVGQLGMSFTNLLKPNEALLKAQANTKERENQEKRRSIERFLAKLRELEHKGFYQEGLAEIETFLAVPSQVSSIENPLALHEVQAMWLLCLKQYTNARRVWESIKTEVPAFDFECRVGWIAYLQGDKSEAQKAFERGIRQSEDSREKNLLNGLLAFVKGDYQRSQLCLEPVLNRKGEGFKPALQPLAFEGLFVLIESTLRGAAPTLTVVKALLQSVKMQMDCQPNYAPGKEMQRLKYHQLSAWIDLRTLAGARDTEALVRVDYHLRALFHWQFQDAQWNAWCEVMRPIEGAVSVIELYRTLFAWTSRHGEDGATERWILTRPCSYFSEVAETIALSAQWTLATKQLDSLALQCYEAMPVREERALVSLMRIVRYGLGGFGRDPSRLRQFVQVGCQQHYAEAYYYHALSLLTEMGVEFSTERKAEAVRCLREAVQRGDAAAGHLWLFLNLPEGTGLGYRGLVNGLMARWTRQWRIPWQHLLDKKEPLAAWQCLGFYDVAKAPCVDRPDLLAQPVMRWLALQALPISQRPLVRAFQGERLSGIDLESFATIDPELPNLIRQLSQQGTVEKVLQRCQASESRRWYQAAQSAGKPREIDPAWVAVLQEWQQQKSAIACAVTQVSGASAASDQMLGLLVDAASPSSIQSEGVSEFKGTDVLPVAGVLEETEPNGISLFQPKVLVDGVLLNPTEGVAYSAPLPTPSLPLEKSTLLNVPEGPQTPLLLSIASLTAQSTQFLLSVQRTRAQHSQMPALSWLQGCQQNGLTLFKKEVPVHDELGNVVRREWQWDAQRSLQTALTVVTEVYSVYTVYQTYCRERESFAKTLLLQDEQARMNRAEMHETRVQQRIQQQAYSDAIVIAEQALSEANGGVKLSTSSRLHWVFLLAELYCQNRAYDKALAQWVVLREGKGPLSESEVCFNIARTYYLQKNWTKAKEAFSTLLTKTPDRADVKGILHFLKGEYAPAARAFEAYYNTHVCGRWLPALKAHENAADSASRIKTLVKLREVGLNPFERETGLIYMESALRGNCFSPCTTEIVDYIGQLIGSNMNRLYTERELRLQFHVLYAWYALVELQKRRAERVLNVSEAEHILTHHVQAAARLDSDHPILKELETLEPPLKTWRYLSMFAHEAHGFEGDDAGGSQQLQRYYLYATSISHVLYEREVQDMVLQSIGEIGLRQAIGRGTSDGARLMRFAEACLRGVKSSNGPAWARLAQFYQFGLGGVSADRVRAEYAIAKAVEAHQAAGQYLQAQVLLSRSTQRSDRLEAVRHLQRAALSGYQPAASLLAFLVMPVQAKATNRYGQLLCALMNRYTASWRGDWREIVPEKNLLLAWGWLNGGKEEDALLAFDVMNHGMAMRWLWLNSLTSQELRCLEKIDVKARASLYTPHSIEFFNTPAIQALDTQDSMVEVVAGLAKAMKRSLEKAQHIVAGDEVPELLQAVLVTHHAKPDSIASSLPSASKEMPQAYGVLFTEAPIAANATDSCLQPFARSMGVAAPRSVETESKDLSYEA